MTGMADADDAAAFRLLDRVNELWADLYPTLAREHPDAWAALDADGVVAVEDDADALAKRIEARRDVVVRYIPPKHAEYAFGA